MYTEKLIKSVLVIYSSISSTGDSDSQVIQSAMKDIESLTCIRYIKQTSEVDYLSYQSQDGYVMKNVSKYAHAGQNNILIAVLSVELNV